jgi:hypothetical protein
MRFQNSSKRNFQNSKTPKKIRRGGLTQEASYSVHLNPLRSAIERTHHFMQFSKNAARWAAIFLVVIFLCL